ALAELLHELGQNRLQPSSFDGQTEVADRSGPEVRLVEPRRGRAGSRCRRRGGVGGGVGLHGAKIYPARIPEVWAGTQGAHLLGYIPAMSSAIDRQGGPIRAEVTGVPGTVKGLSLVSLFNDFASEMVYPLLPA